MTKDFDEDLKQMSIYVYSNGKGKVPDGWESVRTVKNDKNGFYSEVYQKGKEVVIVYRGTNDSKDVALSDIPLGGEFKPAQVKDAEKIYQDIAKDYPSSRIVLTGHSLGGSLAQIISAEYGRKAVTYNAYGTDKILKDMGYKDTRLMDITNYGNPNDPIFMSNRLSQPGTTYITNTNLNPEDTPVYHTKLESKPIKNHHDLDNMERLNKSVKVNDNIQHVNKLEELKSAQKERLDRIKDTIFRKNKPKDITIEGSGSSNQNKGKDSTKGGTKSTNSKSENEKQNDSDWTPSPITLKGSVSYDDQADPYQQKADTLAKLKEPQESKLQKVKDALSRKGKGKGKSTGKVGNGWVTVNGAHIYLGK